MKRYVAGWNIPGCLPESEPAEFDSLLEAKIYLVRELFRYLHELYDAGEVDDAEAEQIEVELLQLHKLEYPFKFRLGHYVFWVDPAE